MLPELGHFALILALCTALVQGIIPLVGAARGMPGWMALARPAALAQFLFLLIAFALLTEAFITNDFSVAYVAQNSNSSLPLVYRISAVWGGHEGSLLLWAVMLGGWTAAVAVLSRRLPDDMVARVLAVMGLVSVGFLLFTLFTSNPFLRLSVAPANGASLNPLLQDPGLVLHPPMLYMGYVGFAVAFGFAIAALISGRLDAAWARWSRPWTIVAWLFLTLGITVGSWWAYYELGWGGWWFWDPVENASFMPWLVGTALMHSLAVTEKRSAFKNWTVLLAISAFSLSLLGTFLVRSGVLSSVHAFANDPARGVFILMLLGAVVGSSLLVYAWRAPKVKSTGRFELVSRESLMLGNNMLLVVAAASILLGTLYPLVLDAFGIGKISVGSPYFDAVFVPIMVPLILAMGVGPLTRWKRDRVRRLAPQFGIVLLVSIVLGVLLPWLLFGKIKTMAAVGIALVVWVLLSVLLDLRHRTRTKGIGGLFRQSGSVYGMFLGHLGVAITIVGIALSSYYSQEREMRLHVGDRTELSGYTFVFASVKDRSGPDYTATVARFNVLHDGQPLTTLRAEKRVYRVRGTPVTEAAIDPGLTRDLYVAMGDKLPNGGWAVRLYYKPFVRWIWFGGLTMVLGGLLAVGDRRYRVIKARSRAMSTTEKPNAQEQR